MLVRNNSVQCVKPIYVSVNVSNRKYPTEVVMIDFILEKTLSQMAFHLEDRHHLNQKCRE